MEEKVAIKVDMLRIIEAHLIRWARWVKDASGLSLGYRRETFESRMMRQGCLPPPANFQRKEYSDEIAEQTEQTIRKMPEHLRIVVEKHYLSKGTIKQKASELKMGRVTFHEHLRMAKYWMHGYLGAEDNEKWRERYET